MSTSDVRLSILVFLFRFPFFVFPFWQGGSFEFILLLAICWSRNYAEEQRIVSAVSIRLTLALRTCHESRVSFS